jgi:2,5-dioxopentanoate dehydrogenase
MELLGTSIIGFQRGQSDQASGRARQPVTGAWLEPEYVAATPDELNQACSMAASAFPRYSALAPTIRAKFLRAIADGLDQLGEALVERMTSETGLPAGRVNGERGRTSGQLRMFAALLEDGSWVDARIDTAQPDRQPLPKPDVRSLLIPIGPVAVFCAGNFPLAYSVAGGDTASALAAGCPVIVLAHSGHPGTAEMVGTVVLEAARATGMPEGVFSLLYGAGHETGQSLVKHPAMRAVGFTGSRRGGRALMDLAAARPDPIPVYAEMSSVNPVFLLPGAVSERGAALATGLHASITTGAGQFCTKPGLIFAIDDTATKGMLDQLAVLLGETAPAPMLNEGIAANYLVCRDRIASVAGVESTASGPVEPAPFCPAPTMLMQTDAATFLANQGLQDEVFGPAALVVLCPDHAGLLACALVLEGQLTGVIHASDGEWDSAWELCEVVRRFSGRLVANGYPTGVEVCHAMVHGGPWPSTSDGRGTSVGSMAITRFCRAACWQQWPDRLLPPELQNANPTGIQRLLNGVPSREPVV